MNERKKTRLFIGQIRDNALTVISEFIRAKVRYIVNLFIVMESDLSIWINNVKLPFLR
jgi:hypothetical protein